ncbi:MAG: hypothetical protein AB1705_12095 [Verrucomicrobiota bacterium]
MDARIHWRLAISCLCAALLPACTSVKVVYHDTGFNNLAAMTIGVAGVTSPEATDYYAQPAIARAMAKLLTEQWPAARVVPLEDVRSALGPGKHDEILASFGERGILKPEDFERLAVVADEIPYMVFIDVREDWPDEGVSQSFTDTDEWERDPKTKECRRVSTRREYQSQSWGSRYVRALMAVYDVRQRKAVWLAVGARGETGMRTAASSAGFPPIPPVVVPSTTEVMEGILARAMRKMPGSTVAKNGSVRSTRPIASTAP